jgi:glucan 1,4-alpha-glucosidase
MHCISRHVLRVALAIVCVGIVAPAGPSGAAARGNVAPGSPGAPPYWAIGRKDGIGSAYETASNVWYTLAGGELTEVFYPTTDTPDVNSLSFIVTDGRTFADRQSVDSICVTSHPDPRSESYDITCRGRGHAYLLGATYLSDPERPTVLIHLKLTQPATAAYLPLAVYVRYDAALNGNGTNDSGRVAGAALLAHDDQGHYGPVASALLARPPLHEGTTGYAGSASDPEIAFPGHLNPGASYAGAGPGNIVQGAFLTLREDGTADLGLGFGPSEAVALRTATASLSQPFGTTAATFAAAWHHYAAGLLQPDSRFSGLQRDQYLAAALALKASEDKRFPGALVASLSTPWGQAVPANQDSGQGYHRVWARDLYEMATGLAAAGDTATARDIVHYMLNILEEPDGSMPQNSLVDGTPVQGALQMDQIAYPLILAWSLGVDDRASYTSHLRLLADFLVRKGPATDQERWEEDPGYSPSTIAAEIAGLIAAAAIAEKSGDAARALVYRAAADDWQRSVKAWTVTSAGPLAHHPYFIRLDDNQDPNDGGSLAIARGPARDERAVVDAGFLELVRLGVLSPTDPDARASLPVIDSTIRVNTAYGAAWYRYSYDTYGDAPKGLPFNQDLPRGVGHPWPVLDGERGEYELSLGHIPQAMDLLETMRQFASPTGMIPEQIWERRAVAPSPPGTPPDSVSIGVVPGQPDGSASPLNWALGQYLRLTADIQTGTVLDRPALAWMRYVAHPVGRARLTVTAPSDDTVGNTARTLTIRGRAAAGSHVVILAASTAGTTLYSPAVAANGAYSQVIAVPAAFLIRVNVAAQDTAGNTALVVRRVRQ